jgi:hypothetical protein
VAAEIDFDLADFVALAAQPTGTASPLGGGPSRELARTPEDETRFQCYHATLRQCTNAEWLATEFATVAEWIWRRGGPTFEVPKHRIRPGRWRVILCYAVDLFCELIEEWPDPFRAARVSRLTHTVERVLSGLEVDDGLDAVRDQLEGRAERRRLTKIARDRVEGQTPKWEKALDCADKIREAWAETGLPPLKKEAVAAKVQHDLKLREKVDTIKRHI